MFPVKSIFTGANAVAPIVSRKGIKLSHADRNKSVGTPPSSSNMISVKLIKNT